MTFSTEVAIKVIWAGEHQTYRGSEFSSINPIEQYACHIGSFPQVGVKVKNIWKHHLVTKYIIYSC